MRRRFERSAASWFEQGAPAAQVDPRRIDALADEGVADGARLRARLVWLGERVHPVETDDGAVGGIYVPDLDEGEVLELDPDLAGWLCAARRRDAGGCALRAHALPSAE